MITLTWDHNLHAKLTRKGWCASTPDLQRLLDSRFPLPATKRVSANDLLTLANCVKQKLKAEVT